MSPGQPSPGRCVWGRPPLEAQVTGPGGKDKGAEEGF